MPLTVHWLAEPAPGAPALAERTARLLEDVDPQAAAEEASVYLAVPDAAETWHGRVALAAGITAEDPEAPYFLTVAPDSAVCLYDLDHVEVDCRSAGG